MEDTGMIKIGVLSSSEPSHSILMLITTVTSTHHESTVVNCIWLWSHVVVLNLLVVQEVVIQVGQIFLAPVAAVGVPLLLKQASDDSSSSELLFSPLPGQERSQEADAWQVALPCHDSQHTPALGCCTAHGCFA